MITKVLEYVERYRMIDPGDTVVAGISGGADSVCLLFVMLEIRKQVPFQLEVVHVDHGIRRESGQDADFVRELCRKLEIPFHLVRVSIPERAALSGLSEEEEGRNARYQAFEQILGGRKGRIAVAHNSNDRAETMLFHLFRGTGLKGMGGIPPVNGKVIRPLLCVERKEIEVWLADRGIGFCQDVTNQQDRYTRNRIRHHILSCAEQQICSGAISNMNRAAEQFLAAEQFVQRNLRDARERCVEENGNGNTVYIRLPEFWQEDPYIQDRLLLESIALVLGSRRDILAVHIDSVRSAFLREGNKSISLPGGLVARRQYEQGILEKAEAQRKDGKKAAERDPQIRCQGSPACGCQHLAAYAVKIPGQLTVPGLGTVDFRVFDWENNQNIPEKTYTKWFDYDKITSVLMLRTRRKGDFLTVNREMGHKSLQDYLVNEKVPKQQRDALYFLAEGSHVLWIPGHRISEYYKIGNKTRRVLAVEIIFSDSDTQEERSS